MNFVLLCFIDACYLPWITGGFTCFSWWCPQLGRGSSSLVDTWRSLRHRVPISQPHWSWTWISPKSRQCLHVRWILHSLGRKRSEILEKSIEDISQLQPIHMKIPIHKPMFLFPRKVASFFPAVVVESILEVVSLLGRKLFRLANWYI